MERTIEECEQAIRLEPNNAELYKELGELYWNDNNKDKAIECYIKAIEFNPNKAELYRECGELYRNNGNHGKAIEFCNKAIELNPNDAEIYQTLGMVYSSYHRDDAKDTKAIEYFSKVIELTPNDPYAYLERGKIYLNKGDSDKAIEDFSKTIELDPSDFRAFLKRGEIYCNKYDYDNLDKAKEDFIRAVELIKTDPMWDSLRGIGNALDGFVGIVKRATKIDTVCKDFLSEYLSYNELEKDSCEDFVNMCVLGEWPLPIEEDVVPTIREAANGSKSALIRLIYLYFSIIIKLVRRYEGKRKEIEFNDLIAVSKYGFAKAVFGYATKEIKLKFVSYASKWIRAELIRKINSERTDIDETNWYQKALEDHNKMIAELDDIELTDEELEEFDTFTDPRDGKVYKTVKIGEQIWMAENLNYECEGSVCYNNDPANGEKYGRLYDLETAKKACPPGWHLPTMPEWNTLIREIGGIEMAGKYLKAQSGWHNDCNGTDKFGFSALPGGYKRDFDFDCGGSCGFFLCASNDSKCKNSFYVWRVFDIYDEINYVTFYNLFLCSVRCLKGEEKIIPPELSPATIEYSGSSTALKYVPEKFKTAELCMEAVKQDGNALLYVPKNLWTAELCLEAVKKSDDVLEYMPSSMKTVEIYLEAAKQWGGWLEYVPEKFITAELCMEVVKKSDNGIEYVPEKFKTAELCMEAVKNDSYGYALKYVPENLKTAELCMKAVEKNSYAFEYVPENLKTAELCMKAVEKNSYAFEYVPEKFKTAELCMKAVKKGRWGEALKYVPEALKTAELYMEAIKENHNAFKYVPEEFKTAELCMEAVKTNKELQRAALMDSLTSSLLSKNEQETQEEGETV